jgi:hypothetical protein
MHPIFVALVELRPRPGGALLPPSAVGGFARCYVRAPDDATALARVTAELEREGCNVVATEWCGRREELTPAHTDEDLMAVAQVTEADVVAIVRVDYWDD